MMMVVDLAVEHHVHRGVLVRDGLSAAGDVDDAEAPHAERHARADVMPFVIGTSMPDGGAHCRQLHFRNVRRPPPARIPRNAAHLRDRPHAAPPGEVRRLAWRRPAAPYRLRHPHSLLLQSLRARVPHHRPHAGSDETPYGPPYMPPQLSLQP